MVRDALVIARGVRTICSDQRVPDRIAIAGAGCAECGGDSARFEDGFAAGGDFAFLQTRTKRNFWQVFLCGTRAIGRFDQFCVEWKKSGFRR